MRIPFFARRFVAGVRMAEALEVVERLNAQGFFASLSVLGEDVGTEARAKAAVMEYRALLQALHDRNIRGDVSLKLTHFGSAVSETLCKAAVLETVMDAKRLGLFVWVDMETAATTSFAVAFYEELLKAYDGVGLALQACLRRTPEDLAHVVSAGGRIRLVKGVYRESPADAYQKKSEVDAAFGALMETLLLEKRGHAVATHNESHIRRALQLVKERNLPPQSFEFQFLYGIRPGLARRLVQEGFRVRIYVPYGPDWAPYYWRRFRERKENVWFALKQVFRR